MRHMKTNIIFVVTVTSGDGTTRTERFSNRDNLEKWLKETTELGCGDDVTVVMHYVDK